MQKNRTHIVEQLALIRDGEFRIVADLRQQVLLNQVDVDRVQRHIANRNAAQSERFNVRPQPGAYCVVMIRTAFPDLLPTIEIRILPIESIAERAANCLGWIASGVDDFLQLFGIRLRGFFSGEDLTRVVFANPLAGNQPGRSLGPGDNKKAVQSTTIFRVLVSRYFHFNLLFVNTT